MPAYPINGLDSTTGMTLRGLLAAFVTVFWLSGCSTPSPSMVAQENAEYQRWKQVAAESPEAGPPAPEYPGMRDYHAPGMGGTGPQEASRQELPTISVESIVLTREMDVAVLLRALADAADLNVLIGENVGGPVLVNLRRETRWDRLFLGLVEAHGLHYTLEDDFLRIFSLEDVERRIAMEQALHGQLQAARLRARAEPMAVDMVRVRYANPEKLAESVRVVMQAIVGEAAAGGPAATAAAGAESDRPRFLVRADSDSGQLIIHGAPADIQRARSLVRGMDQPTYQVVIEATIVQANSETARQLGVQWGAFHTADSSRVRLGNTPRGDGFNSNFPAAFEIAEPGFIYGIRRVSGSQFLQAQLSALQKDGLLNIVSNPSITTLDQQTAVVETGEERPFVSAAGTGIAAIPQIEWKRAVLRLEVTPQVVDENWIKLVIITKKEDFDDARAIVIAGNIQVPILTRSALTTLYLADGQTTVIGGLSSQTQSSQESGIPLLKDIPGLGALFRNSNNRTALNDTLIFITPRILPNSANRENEDL